MTAKAQCQLTIFGEREYRPEDLGLVWVNDLQRSYFVEAREITTGGSAGQFEVTLLNGRSMVVSRESINRWPRGTEGGAAA